jgi:two-component system OmpR family response regulator
LLDGRTGIEDDKTIAKFIVKGLTQASFAVDHRGSGTEGLDLALSEAYDVAIIDLMLPGLDGLSLIRELRQKKADVPVIILSAKRSVDDRVRGFHTGSDDYLTKPFAFVELLARVRALIRRAHGGAESTRLTAADLSMDLLTRQIVRGHRRIELQPREFSLLEYLLRNADRVVSKTMILEHVWDYHFDPQTNVVDVLICRLRNKIEISSSDKLIHTIRGVGYVLKSS